MHFHWKPSSRWVLLGVVALVGVVVCVLLHFYPPGQEGSFWPKCFFHELTGLLCPGCGSTRALYAYTHGDILRGMHCNLLLPFMIAFFAAVILKPELRFNRVFSVSLFSVVLLFTLLRNLPFGCCACLAP